jgi:hypothetical protein
MPLPGTPFRREAAGAVAEPVRKRIESFEGSGALFGQWRKQETIARELAERRSRRSHPAPDAAPRA